MLAGQVDGVSADDATAQATLSSLKRFAAERPMVYLPTHDPESAERLSRRRLVVTRSSVGFPTVSADGRNVIGGINVLRDPDFFWTMRWTRADAMGVLAAALWGVTVTHGSWAWFFAL